MIVLKIVLIGDGGVGKTAIRERYLGEGFDSDYVMTIGADFATKDYILNKKKVRYQIWDLAGQERFDGVRDVYYKGALGALLVYDVTRLDSYYNLLKWVNELWSNNGKGRIPIIVVGNKIDLRKSHGDTLGPEQGDKITKDLNKLTTNEGFTCHYIETSAKTGERIDKAFSLLGNNILKFAEKRQQIREKTRKAREAVAEQQIVDNGKN